MAGMLSVAGVAACGSRWITPRLMAGWREGCRTGGAGAIYSKGFGGCNGDCGYSSAFCFTQRAEGKVQRERERERERRSGQAWVDSSLNFPLF